MKMNYAEGLSILNRIKEYCVFSVNLQSVDCEYANRVRSALTGGGYDQPIPEEKLAKWLEKAYRKGKRIRIEADCEYLSGDELKAYLKKHPHHSLKAGICAGQCDGWSSHCVIDNDSDYNPEVGF